MDSITHAGTLHGHGETGALFHNFDWSSTELGSPGSWPDSLTIATSICLNSRFPMGLWWGAFHLHDDLQRRVPIGA